MKARSISLISFFAIMLMAKASFAAEIITIEDFKQELVMKEHLVKVADNAIFLFDGSSSMNQPYKDTGQSKYDVAVAEFKKRNAYMPDLGQNFGLYLYTPWKPIYPMQPYQRQKFAAALDSLPAKGEGLTLLQVGLREIDPVLATLSGDTAVFVFTDGTYTKEAVDSFSNLWIPAHRTAKALADKYDVCFYVISTASKKQNRKIINNVAKVNACSRVIPFEAFIDRPEFHTGALFTVRSSMNLVTTSDQKVVGLKADNIQFEFGQAEIQPAARQELDEVGQFLRQKENYSAYIALEAFTDNVGTKEYNQLLSRRRAQSVADYLKKNHRVNPNRVVMQWYGDADPIATNDTPEGRALNRRVEMAIGGLQ